MILDNSNKKDQNDYFPNISKNMRSSGQIKIDLENLKILNFDNKIDNEIKIKKHKNAANKNSKIETQTKLHLISPQRNSVISN